MPSQNELGSYLSDHAKQGLPHRSFSEEELRNYLNTTTFDGGASHTM
jgi:hypothetical protein